MIQWLLQSVADMPDLESGGAAAPWLSSPEQERLTYLHFEKRRREWLLGRWTAKLLVQSYVEQVTGQRLPLEALIIGREPEGQPLAALDAHFAPDGFVAGAIQPIPLVAAKWRKPGEESLKVAGVRLPVSLSISHSGNYALSALALTASGIRQIGVDVEMVEPRESRFVDRYYTVEESTLIQRCAPEWQEMLITAFWSAKEAVLKALRLGLTVDTRHLSCLPEGTIGQYDAPSGERSQGPLAGWQSLRIQCAPDVLAKSPVACGHGRLIGWWRLSPGYALTMAALR